MIAPNRLLVVGNDPAFVQMVSSQLGKHLDQPPMTCRYDAVRQHLGPGTDGLILLLANQPADAPAVKDLLQEVQILHYNPRMMLVETTTAGIDGSLNGFQARLSERRPWTENSKDFISSVEQHANANQGLGFFDPAHESIKESICRRLVSHTPSLSPLAEQLALAAAHDVTVLLDGETGTGKTFLARLIHDCSPRAAQRFLVVPCGAIAPHLIENEFFGHAQGAFTGADAAKVGKFAAVGAGTLLLDEIDVLSLEQQANLVRVLESGEFEPVGSHESQTSHARVMATTNLNLEEAVDIGVFRRDLYYRLNVVSFHLPPLRERVHDIEPLVRGLVARFAIKFRKELVSIHPETIRVLEEFDWPGNIRQLENVIQQAVLLSSCPEMVVKNLSALVQNRCEVFSPRAASSSLTQSREAAERSTILRALELAAYSRTRAAAALGISRVTLYKKMRVYGLLDRPGLPGSRQGLPGSRQGLPGSRHGRPGT